MLELKIQGLKIGETAAFLRPMQSWTAFQVVLAVPWLAPQLLLDCHQFPNLKFWGQTEISLSVNSGESRNVLPPSGGSVPGEFLDMSDANVGRAKPAKVALERDTWLVENFVKPEGIQTLPDAQMKHKVQVRDCDGLALQVDPKVNSLILDSCKNMRVCVNSLIATVEIVNCHKVKLQVTGTVPAISIDKSQKIDIFVSEQSKGVEITTSKSSEMNMNYPVPGDEGDWVEVVIPEQYHHKLGADSKLETRVSNLYSC